MPPSKRKQQITLARQVAKKRRIQEDAQEEIDDLAVERKLIEEITEYLNSKENSKIIGTKEKARLQAILQYLRLYQTGMKEKECSRLIAIINGKSSYWGHCLILWTKEWRMHGKITLSHRGKHPKTKSLLTEDLSFQLKEWLCAHHKFDVTPYLLQKHVNEVILPGMSHSKKGEFISEKTATRWLKALGWVWSEVKKGIYVDGHERADVVAYRQGFLQKMKEYERRIIYADGPELDALHVPSPPDLYDDEHPLIFYTHDESVFYSNDGQQTIWHPKKEMPLRKKGKGRSIMVSDFLSEVCGPLTHIQEDGEKLEAREIIHPGKTHDGYWTGKDVANQFKKAISIHKKAYPQYDALWAFDNSCNHGSFASDALKVEKMNLNPGGKQELLRDTFFNGQRQTMVFPANYPDENLREKAKGMKQVLQERGLWKNTLVGICKKCKIAVKDPEQLECCAQRILELQPDFMAQKTMLEEIAEAEGQKIIFYPKFHCEFNFIEMYWGRAKSYARKNCDYTFAGLQKTVPIALDSVDLKLIRKFSRKAFRYMDVYREGVPNAEIEKFMQTYKSHRKINMPV
jgi:hypothetical protein